MKAGSLIVFSGLDGAGKSTQIEKLAQALQDVGIRPIVLWTRLGYTPGMNHLRRLARLLLGRRMPPPGPSAARRRVMNRPWVRRWWLRLAMTDLWLRWAVQLRICRALGYTVLCDRYWPDSQLDLQLHFPQEAAWQWTLWKYVVRCCPPADASFLLLVGLKDYRVRSRQKEEPFPLTDDGFRQRERLYAPWASHPDWTVLDGGQPPHVVAERVASRCLPARLLATHPPGNLRQYS